MLKEYFFACKIVYVDNGRNRIVENLEKCLVMYWNNSQWDENLWWCA